MIPLQTGTCVLFLLSVIVQCQGAALPVVQPGQQGGPEEQTNALQSGHTSIEDEVESLAGRFGEENVKQCCRNSLPHYESTQNCYEKPRGMTEDENSPCFKAFQQCCLQVKAYSKKPSFISSRSMIKSGQQTEVEPGQQTDAEPVQQTEVEPGQQTEVEPVQQTEEEHGQQTDGGLDEQTEAELEEQIEEELGQQTEEEFGQQKEEEPDHQTEEEPDQLIEEVPEEQTEEVAEEQTEEEPEEQTEEEPEEQTEEETEEQTEEEPEEQTEEETDELIETDPEDYPGGEGQPLLSLQLSLQVSKPSDDELNAGLEDDQTSLIDPEDQPDLEELLSGQTSLEEK